MSEIKLLQCPLCGGSVELHEIEPHTHVLAKFMSDCKGEVIIECKCGCSIMRSTKAEAVDAWNHRKPIEDMVEQLEKASDYYECDEQGREHVQMVDLEKAIDIVRGGRE